MFGFFSASKDSPSSAGGNAISRQEASTITTQPWGVEQLRNQISLLQRIEKNLVKIISQQSTTHSYLAKLLSALSALKR